MESANTILLVKEPKNIPIWSSVEKCLEKTFLKVVTVHYAPETLKCEVMADSVEIKLLSNFTWNQF